MGKTEICVPMNNFVLFQILSIPRLSVIGRSANDSAAIHAEDYIYGARAQASEGFRRGTFTGTKERGKHRLV